MMTSLMCIVFMSIPAFASLLIRWNVVDASDIVLGISIVPPGYVSITYRSIASQMSPKIMNACHAIVTYANKF